jgi:hypothetical protein
VKHPKNLGWWPTGTGQSAVTTQSEPAALLSLLQWFGLKIFKLQFRKLAAF